MLSMNRTLALLSRGAFAWLAAPGLASAEAAAARDVLVSQLARIGAPFPPQCSSAGMARVETDFVAALAAIADGPAKTRGIALGQAAAAATAASAEVAGAALAS